jgi:AMP nucleosidase
MTLFNPFGKRTQRFRDPAKALEALHEIYDGHVAHLRDEFRGFVGGKVPAGRVSAPYPFIRINVENATRADTRLSYGFVPKPGVYESTVTRPDIFGNYYLHQMDHLIRNHNVPIEIGLSEISIPIHFALGEDFHLEADLNEEQLKQVPYLFDNPDMSLMDDNVANGTYEPQDSKPNPLSLFTAQRVDLSLMRLRHYTGTSASHFQNFVIFTNYQFYIDEFCRICNETMTRSTDDAMRRTRMNYTSFVEPGNKITINRNLELTGGERDDLGQNITRLPQMPAYHLKRADHSGITMINIGVGPSNAKTITDHVAVLRPHAWLMLGHCAGLRNSQNLGDYVLAHGYLREDNVLYRDLHPSIPIPALSEIQQALEKAVAEVTGHDGYDLKKIMRTGTIATVDDRNWELRPASRQNTRLSQSRAIALDMESGTVAANGFRYRVPYGTLLCVSDKPLHGQLKLPGMAESFYRQRVDQHLQIGLLAMTMLRDIGTEKLHSRKLRSFNEVAFQ